MDKPENRQSDNGETLRKLLQKRQELDHLLESKYTKSLTLMFTDIKGSTQFFETYGDLDGRILLEKHNQILYPILSEYKGKVIKSTGDGMLVVFDKPQDGVKAAIAMQKKLWEFNKGKSKREQIHIRIAVNYGKVIEDEGDVYSLAVSVTDRIKSVTKTDQILISQSVYEEVQHSKDIICLSIPSVRVKGIQQPLKLYRVIWRKDELLGKDTPSPVNVFVLEFTKEAEKIKISGYEKVVGEQKTVRHYEEVKVDDAKIRGYNTEVINLLNRASQKGHVSREILDRLKTTGQLLYDEIFSLELKRKLAATASEDMIISIDDNLVNIPWELLHDGNSFFCLRFNMGRLVSTRQTISEITARQVGLPLKMLILSDPQGNLKSAYREGYSIRDKLVNMESIVNVNIKSSSIKCAHFLEKIRNFDILHYAGHADYDKNNPSNSGFLMEDGKLKASDIINLIGTKPLPSLVFSNACKSGHTDKWRVGEDYGTEIFGLANAFLLAGVRHYIGTFWDVQDEPGLHFALNFYKELTDGAAVGAAVRKARLRLIEKYGEDAVIWASYMLYGDPVFKYVELLKPEEPKVKKERSIREESRVARGSTRTTEEVVAFPPKRQRLALIGFVLLLILSILLVFFILRPVEKPPPLQIPVEVGGESREAKQKRIDELVASLVTNYQERQKTGKGKAVDVWKSSLPTLVFLNIKASGITELEKEYILSRITNNLQSSKRVLVVEREVLDKLLEELKLSSSQLADPATALRVGRILSAKLISTGSIVREGSEWQLSLRIIETETTSIKAALAESFKTEDKDNVADNLSQKILKKIRAEYPLQGKILSFEGEKVVLDIGSEDGVTVGLKMEVISEEQGTRIKMGELVITSVEEKTSYAKITSGPGIFKEGSNARELL